jgi:hypothetical protein
VTEFLIFLAMCGVFVLAFRWFLRLPNSDQRMKSHVDKEMAALRAKVAAEDAVQAPAQGFGRKAPEPRPQQFVPSAGQFPLESYGGTELRTPLGHDPVNPDSRTIPQSFQGNWLREGATSDTADNRISLQADSLTYMPALGAEPVVGTYEISPSEIAVVTQQMEDGQWLFATYLFKLLDGGRTLTNLESMDVRWSRIE